MGRSRQSLLPSKPEQPLHSHLWQYPTLLRNFQKGEHAMTYVLLALAPEDKQRILADATTDHANLRWLEYAINSGAFPETWALDKQHNNYLLWIPSQTREESTRQPYCAFIDDHMYRLARGGFFSSHIYFDEDALPSAPVISAVQREVSLALAVYGWMGGGPDDDFGDPSLLGIRFVERMPLDAM